jgi:hypothetical protein
MGPTKRELRIIALHLITRWLPEAAPLLPPVAPACAEHLYPTDAGKRDRIAGAMSNMADCACAVVAAGRRGAQRLAVTVIAVENAAGNSPNVEVTPQFHALIRVLHLFATTPARKFLLTKVRSKTTATETTTREGNATRIEIETTTTRVVNRATLAADSDTDDGDTATQPVAPLTHVALDLWGCTAASLLASALVTACSPGGDSFGVPATTQHHSYDAAPGAVAAALRPRSLNIRPQFRLVAAATGFNKNDLLSNLVPWIQQQKGLRCLRVSAANRAQLDVIIQAVSGAPLEELDFRDLAQENASIVPVLFETAGRLTTLRFPGLRILRMPGKEIRGSELLQIAAAATSLEIIEAREHSDFSEANWAQVLRETKSLHTLLMAPPLPDPHFFGRTPIQPIPAFYRALGAPNFTPACTLRVLSREFNPDATHAVLNAVSLQLPHLESIALPVDIFDALAFNRAEDKTAKDELRGAVRAATKRCKRITLYTQSGDLQLHVDALHELLHLLPNLRRLGPLSVFTGFRGTPSLFQTIIRGGAVASTDIGPGHTEPQLRELHLTGPLTRAALATLTRACPHLRVLHCVYGGARPLVKMDHAASATLQFVSLMSEAVFIDWLGAILDVSAAKYLIASVGGSCTTAALAVGQQQVLHHLRQLRVAKPPFDGERDAANMAILEGVRAQSHVLITFT